MTIRRSLLLVVACAAGVACGARSARDTSNPSCSDDIRVCKDGTPISRVGPDCEFTRCPGRYDGATFDVDGEKEDGLVPPIAPTEPDGNSPPNNPG
jgi:hypothetical protein